MKPFTWRATASSFSCNQFPGTVAPKGYEHLTSFRKDLFPVFEFEAGGVKLRKTVAAVDGENTTLVLYEVLEAPAPFILSLRPFLAARDLNELAAANPAIQQEAPFTDGVLSLRPYPEIPELFVQVSGADFRHNPQWWYRFEYERDRRRGFDFQEDLWTPGVLGREMAVGDRLGIVISTQSVEGRDAFALFEKERKRREKIVKALPVQDGIARSLALAVDGSMLRGGPSREVLIALPGLCLVTGRLDDAKKILRAAAKTPGPVNASLWLFVAAWKYLQATGDEAFVRQTLLPALRKAVHAVDRGKLEKIEGVELNALWYNALSILAEIETRLGDPEEAKRLSPQAKRVQKAFQEAFYESADPSRIFALSLPFPLLAKGSVTKALAAFEEGFDRSAWTPLLGPYLTALVRVQGTAGRKKALSLIESLIPRLAEADTESWGMAEVLRAYVEDVQVGKKESVSAKGSRKAKG